MVLQQLNPGLGRCCPGVYRRGPTLSVGGPSVGSTGADEPPGDQGDAMRGGATSSDAGVGKGAVSTAVVGRAAARRVAAMVLSAGAAAFLLIAPPTPDTASASTPPGAPTNVTAVARDQSITVSWNPPAADGSDVAAYRAVAQPGFQACETRVYVDDNPLTCTITGLTNGQKYQVMVAARTGASGWGLFSPDDRYAVGDWGHAGGRILYDAGAMQTWGRYIEVAPAGWDGKPASATTRVAFCNRDEVLGVTATAMGTGAANTAAILEKCPWSGFKAVAEYGGGHRGDWFVPSADEMAAIWGDRHVVDMPSACDHWTSSESSSSKAWTVRDSHWTQRQSTWKSMAACVRPIRYVDGTHSALFVTPNDGLPGLITDLRIAGGSAGRGYTSVRLEWTPPDAYGNPVVGHRVRVAANDRGDWRLLENGGAEGTYLLDDLPYSSARVVQVAAVTEFGRGPWSAPLLVTTKGASAKEVWIMDARTNPVRGGTVTWEMVPRTAWSSVPYGLDSAGEIVFPSAPAGTVRVTLTDGVLEDGSLVSGEWTATLGFGLTALWLPANPLPSRTVAVTLPGDLPVSNASVTFNGLTDTYRNGGFTFTMPSFRTSGRTDAAGTFTAFGFPDGTVTADVVYDDGVIGQQQTIAAAAPVSFVELEYAPYVEPVDDGATVDVDEPVEVTLEARLGAPRSGAQASRGYIVSQSRPQAGVRVTLVPPAGARAGTCGARLTGVTDARGRVQLRVCATKSGVYRVRSAGAMPVGGYTLRVRGAASMPPAAVTAFSPRIGTATVTWRRPSFTGGATVSAYRVVLTARGEPTIQRTIQSRPGTNLTASFTGLAHATTYRVSVIAVTKYGLSDAGVTTVPVA